MIQDKVKQRLWISIGAIAVAAVAYIAYHAKAKVRNESLEDEDARSHLTDAYTEEKLR